MQFLRLTVNSFLFRHFNLLLSFFNRRFLYHVLSKSCGYSVLFHIFFLILVDNLFCYFVYRIIIIYIKKFQFFHLLLQCPSKYYYFLNNPRHSLVWRIFSVKPFLVPAQPAESQIYRDLECACRATAKPGSGAPLHAPLGSSVPKGVLSLQSWYLKIYHLLGIFRYCLRPLHHHRLTDRKEFKSSQEVVCSSFHYAMSLKEQHWHLLGSCDR